MEKIAIIGMGCLFPGASNIEELWALLEKNETAITDYTDKELGKSASFYTDKTPESSDKLFSLKSGIIKNYQFDSHGYTLPSNFIDNLDEMFKWSMDVSKQALLNSGYYQDEILKKTGLLLGVSCFPSKKSKEYFLPYYTDILNKNLELIPNASFNLDSHIKKFNNSIYNNLIMGSPASILLFA